MKDVNYFRELCRQFVDATYQTLDDGELTELVFLAQEARTAIQESENADG
jgi:hypothetical protein